MTASGAKRAYVATTKKFVKKWVMPDPTHRCALGIGHHADELVKIAEALGVDYCVIK